MTASKDILPLVNLTSSKIKVTPEIYAANIPSCCRLQSLEAHESIMLCWGLVNSIENNNKIECGWCEFNNEHTREEWAAWWKDFRSKQKMWDNLSC